MPVSEIKSGQTASFALKKIKRSQIRKGDLDVVYDSFFSIFFRHCCIDLVLNLSTSNFRNGDGVSKAEPAVLLGV